MNCTLIAYRVAAEVIPRLPYRAVEWVAEAVGLGSWLANGRGRRAVRANLRTVLNREPTATEVRKVFATAASNYCDLFFMPRLDPGKLVERVAIEGWENLRDALSLERGAIVASLHLGNLEVVGYAATLHGMKVMLPVERIEPPELLTLMQDARRKAGFVLEPVGSAAFDRIREALKVNSIVGIGADRIALGNGELVSFCGRPAQMPTAAALLALRTGAPLLPIAVTRLPRQHFRLRIGHPIAVARASTVRNDARRITESLLAELAVDLRANPSQWVVFRPIWKEERRFATSP